MAGFRFAEMPSSGGGSVTEPTEERKYFAAGSTSGSFIKDYAIGATPFFISTSQGTLYRQDIKVDFEYADQAIVTVPYGKNQSNSQTGSYTVSFDTTGGTVTIKASLETRARYKAVGEADAPDLKGAIDWDGETVNGTEIVIPALKLNVSFRHPAGIITLAQIKNLARNTGKVNSANFLTFAPGEVLFLGATGEQGSESETTINYQFACSENLQNKIIGNITVVEKRGWDVSWIRFKPNTDANKPVTQPQYIYIERVYEEVNLAALLGFGA